MRSNPLQLAKLTTTGCSLMLLAYGLSFLPFHDLPEHNRMVEMVYNGRWELLLTAVPFLVGVFIAFFYQRRITQGMDQSLWTEEQLEQARSWVNAPALTIAQCLIVLALFIAWISGIATHHHIGSGLGVIIAVNPLTAVRQSLSRPRLFGPRLDWRQSAPIYSDHWGRSQNSLP